jgi:hypothetical protein
MDWEVVGKLLTLISLTAIGIAVVNWIAGQLRQYTLEARLGAFQNSIVRAQRWNRDIAGDPELARIYSDGLADPKSLSPIDLVRFEAHTASQFRNWEDEFRSFAQGMADEEVFAGRRAAMKDDILQPGLLWYWDRHRAHFSLSFGRFIESELKALTADAEEVDSEAPGLLPLTEDAASRDPST